MPTISIPKFFKDHWALAIQFGVAVSAEVTGIVYAPKFETFQNVDVSRLSQYLAASLLLLSFIPIIKWKKRKYQFTWWIISCLLFVISIIGVIKYQNDLNRYSVVYGDSRVIIGELDEMNDPAKAQKKKLELRYGKPFSLEDCIQFNGGNATDFWNRVLLSNNFNLIMVEYIFLVSFISLFVLFVIQAIKSNSRVIQP